MRHTPSLAASLVLALLAGCTGWSPATGPAGTPSGTAPGIAGFSPMPGALGGGTQPGQGPTAERKLYAVWVMKGRALVDGTTPLANAELRAYDVQTGLPLSFGAWDMAGARTLPGVARTDAEGRWTLAFTPIAGNRVLRLVARTKDHTVVTLFTSTGQVLPGQAEGGAGKYRLKATGTNPLFQNALWWFGTPNPPPSPERLEVWTFRPLAMVPGFLGPTFGWMQNANFDTCVLGSTARIGPCGTITHSYNHSGCAYRVLSVGCGDTPLKEAQSDPPASPSASPSASATPQDTPSPSAPASPDASGPPTLADNPVDQEKAAELMAEVPIDPNTTLNTVALEAGKVKFNLKLSEFTKAVEQTKGTERTALKDALDALQKAIENTSKGSTFQAFASAFFAENGTVSDAKGFTEALSKGSSAFKSSFQAILNYLDVTFESDPAASGATSPDLAASSPTAPTDLFADTGSAGSSGSRRRRAAAPPTGFYARLIGGAGAMYRGLAVEADGNVLFGDPDAGVKRWNGTSASLVVAASDMPASAVAVGKHPGLLNTLYVGGGPVGYWQDGSASGTWGFDGIRACTYASGTLYAIRQGTSPSGAVEVFREEWFFANNYITPDMLQVDGQFWTAPGSGFHGLAVDATPGATPTVYVSNEEGEIYAVQDGAATHSLIARNLGSLRGLALNPDTRTLYAACWGSRRIVAIDLDSTSTIDEIGIYPALQPNGRPWGLGLDADGDTLWVTEDVTPLMSAF